VAAFYLSSMPPELLERNGVDPAVVAAAIAAFNAGDLQRALELTPPAVFGHLPVTFADPFLDESWAGLTIEGLPSLDQQIRLFRESVSSAF
jgi:hypothetical protein